MYNTVLSVVFVINNNSANSILSGILILDIPFDSSAGKLSKPFCITSVIIPNKLVTLPLAADSPAAPKIVCCVTTGLCLLENAVPGKILLLIIFFISFFVCISGCLFPVNTDTSPFQ